MIKSPSFVQLFLNCHKIMRSFVLQLCYKLTSAFFAASSLVLDVFILTTSFHINFLRPVSSGQLIAEGAIKFSSEKLVIAESHLFNDAGKEIAFGVGHFTKSKVPLSKDIGYA